jgi:hypothetical protein
MASARLSTEQLEHLVSIAAALTFASITVRRYSGHHLDCQAVLRGRSWRVYSGAEFVYWPIALVLAAATGMRWSRGRPPSGRLVP